MFSKWLIFVVPLGYLCLLFSVAYFADRRAGTRNSLVANPYVYSLSIAVYCTSWTFYGSVGRAASSGLGFLPIYLGPTLVFILAPFLLRKIVRIAKTQHSTSIADFIAARYGKSQLLAGLVTVIAVIGIMPYISLQLKATSRSLDIVSRYPEISMGESFAATPIYADTALYVALILGIFAILFGTRKIDSTEHHEGVVVAVAFESLIKLLAFVAVGVFVTYGLFDGFSDIYKKASTNPDLAQLFSGQKLFEHGDWTALMILSMFAIFCLPRQFQVTVIENVKEDALDKAMWLFPLYLLLINIFVLPIAFGGLLTFPDGSVDADTFVLTLPMAGENPFLALLAFIGGLSAATAMVIVAVISLSTMVCNDLVLPLLLKAHLLNPNKDSDLTGLLKMIRRISILFILVLSFLYVRLVGDSYALVTIGLVSFAAAAQFAPAIIGGIYWKDGSRKGALAGLSGGFVIWLYTLLLPSFARSGWLPTGFIEEGLFGLAFLKPYALFGLEGYSATTHSLLWSMLFNIGLYVVVSLFSKQDLVEKSQASLFVHPFNQPEQIDHGNWQAPITVGELETLARKFVSTKRVKTVFAEHAAIHQLSIKPDAQADNSLIRITERMLAGVIGAASARVVMASAVKGPDINIQNMQTLIDEASQAIETSRDVLNAVVENIGQGITMFDQDYNLISWNKRFHDLLNISDQEIKSGMSIDTVVRTIINFSLSEKGDKESLIRYRLSQAKKLKNHTYEHICQSGRIIEIEGNPVQGGGFVFTYTDITARKQVERKMERSAAEEQTLGKLLHLSLEPLMTEEFLQKSIETLLGSVPFLNLLPKGGIFIADSDQQKLRLVATKGMNDELLTLCQEVPFGKCLCGKAATMKEIIYSSHVEEDHTTSFDHMVDHGHYNVPLLSGDTVLGVIVLYLPAGYERRDDEIKFLSRVSDVISMGITRRKAETALRRLNEELERRVGLRTQELHKATLEAREANEAKSDFLAKMSHELRTPLNAVIGITEMMEEDAEEEGNADNKESLSRVRRAGEHLLALINDILDLSKIEAGRMEFRPEVIQIKELLDDVEDTAAPLTALHQNKMEFTCPDHIGSMWGDPLRLKQILLNLLSNACKFTDKGTIALTADRIRIEDHDWITFEISDTGIGLKEEDIESLFQDFAQVDSSLSRQAGGTGLGLSISRRMCRIMGGDITVISTPGEGSTFAVKLPVETLREDQANRQDLVMNTNQTYVDPHETHTILVIDDDDTARNLIVQSLEKEGFKTVQATSGTEGLKLARQINPAAITLDVMMPDISGWDALVALKNDDKTRNIPVIMATVVDETAKGFDLGAADYLVKPINREKLCKAVRCHAGIGVGLNALVVEDDEDTRELIHQILTRDGWNVDLAENGRVALSCLENAIPDIIILDLVMPIMNGFDLLDKIADNAKWNKVPVIILTGRDLSNKERDQLNTRAIKIMSKGETEGDTLAERVHKEVANYIHQGKDSS